MKLGYRKPSKDGEIRKNELTPVMAKVVAETRTEGKGTTPDSKPSFKDAEEGIDVKDLRTAGKILEVYKKILEVEVL